MILLFARNSCFLAGLNATLVPTSRELRGNTSFCGKSLKLRENGPGRAGSGEAAEHPGANGKRYQIGQGTLYSDRPPGDVKLLLM